MAEVLVNDFSTALVGSLSAGAGNGTTFTVSPEAPASVVGSVVRARAVVNGVRGEIFTATVTTTTTWTVVARAVEDASRWPAQSYVDGTTLELDITRDGLATLLGQAMATTNVVHVDKSGSDTTGLRGRADKPFLTLAAAKAAAQTGDVIVVRPGTYNERNLFKNGVHWLGLPGADIVYTGAGPGAIFDDSANGTSGAVSCGIEWAGTIRHAQGSGSSLNSAAVRVSNAGSNIRLRAGVIETTTTLGGHSVMHENGTLSLVADTVAQLATTAGRAAIWWTGGTGRYQVGLLKSDGANSYAFYGSATTPTNADLLAGRIEHLPVADEINGAAVYCNAHTTDARIWVQALEIQGKGIGVYNISGKLYVTAEKISAASPIYLLTNPAGVLCQTWLRAQKVTNTGLIEALPETLILDENAMGMFAEIDIDHMEFGTGEFAVTAFQMNAGPNCTLRIGQVTLPSTAYGIGYMADGVLEAGIDGTASAVGSGPILSADGGKLRNCVIRAPGGRNALGAGTVEVEGTLTLNRPYTGTLTGGPVIRNDLGTSAVLAAPPSLADGSAPNGTVYYSTTQSKLVYKDAGGVVHALY